MKVQWLGEPQGPDEITMRGFTFERKGEPVEIPDNHPHADKWINNHYFKVVKAPKELIAPLETKASESATPAEQATPADFEDAHPHGKGKPGPKPKTA